MMSLMVVCHYDEIITSNEDDALYTVGERRVVIIDGDVTFDRFES